MAGTAPDLQAANIANSVIAFASEAKGIANRIQALMDQWNALNTYAMLEAFPTCATEANGTLGAADTTPVTTNVMDPRVEPSSQVSLAISVADVGGLITFLENGLKAVCEGTAVAANPQVPELLAKVM